MSTLSPEEAAGREVRDRAFATVRRVPLGQITAAQPSSPEAAQLPSPEAAQPSSSEAAQLPSSEAAKRIATRRVGTRARPYLREDGVYTRPFSVVIDVRVIDGVDDFLRPQVRAGKISLARYVELGLRRLIEERWIPDELDGG